MDSHISDLQTTGTHLGNQATDTATNAIRSTQAMAQNLLNRVADSAAQARDQASPVIDRVAGQAESATRRGIDAVRERADQMRERAHHASDVTINYIQQEPLKSVLAAAATGALLMGVFSLLSRSRRSH